MPARKLRSKLPLSAQEFSALVLALHELATEPGKLMATLGMCCSYIGAPLSTLALVETRTGRMRYIAFHPEPGTVGEEYENEWADRDPMKAALLRAEPRKFYVRDHLIPLEEQERDPFYSQWCAGHRFDEVCIARIPIGGALHCNWGFIRSSDQPRFSALELAFLDTLLPHLETALLLHQRLDRMELFADIAREWFRHSGNGVVGLSRSGSILFADTVGREFLGDSRAFVVSGRSLRLRDESAHEALAALVAKCLSVADSTSMLAGGTVRVPVAGSEHSLLVGVMPFRGVSGPSTLSSGGARAVLTLFDATRPTPDTREELRTLYGLSAAEADVCWRVANGDTVARIAKEAGRSRETVRSQLKRVFAKTGTKRQPELVRVVLLGPSSWLAVMQ